jgi:hypothetical protein
MSTSSTSSNSRAFGPHTIHQGRYSQISISGRNELKNYGIQPTDVDGSDDIATRIANAVAVNGCRIPTMELLLSLHLPRYDISEGIEFAANIIDTRALVESNEGPTQLIRSSAKHMLLSWSSNSEHRVSITPITTYQAALVAFDVCMQNAFTTWEWKYSRKRGTGLWTNVESPAPVQSSTSSADVETD